MTGDPGDSRSFEIRDADTGALLQVDTMKLEMAAGAYTTVEVRYTDGTKELCYVQPAPQKPAAVSGLMPGQQLVALSIEASENLAMNALRFKLRAARYEETGHGVQRMANSGKDFAVSAMIGHHVMHSVKDPRDAVLYELERQGGTLGRGLIMELLRQCPSWASPKPPMDRAAHFGGVETPTFAKGGIVNYNQPYSFDVDDALSHNSFTKNKPPPKCDECKGTGVYECPVTAKKSPCSKGCAPAPGN